MRLMKPLILLAALLPALVCAEPAKESPAKETPAPAKPPQVQLVTSEGEIVIELNPAKAPATVENFLGYVKKKHYDGTVFHRVIRDFMIQGGGFAVQDGKLTEKPVGKPVVNESRNGLKNLRGTIAMARRADPDSATAQFFINTVDNPMLDHPNNGGYAVFGKVVGGMDVVDKIRAVPTAAGKLEMKHPVSGETIEAPAGDVPTSPVTIRSAVIAD
jgi:cyclophilin family peptidyl-prolyl cis-trans isomerase